MSNEVILKKALLEWYLASGVRFSIFPLQDNKLENKRVKFTENYSKEINTIHENIEIKNILTKCNSIQKLEELIKNYCNCVLKKTAKNMVFSDGNSRSNVMLLGEAPGAEEDKTGKPFVGEAGLLLDKMLNAIGQNRNNTYITNILFWRPPGNRKPTDQEIYSCMPFVKKHIEIINPKILILAGATAAKSIYNVETGITQIRGKWNNINIGSCKNLKSMAIFHPAFLLRQPARKREAWEDLKKIKIEIDKYT